MTLSLRESTESVTRNTLFFKGGNIGVGLPLSPSTNVTGVYAKQIEYVSNTFKPSLSCLDLLSVCLHLNIEENFLNLLDRCHPRVIVHRCKQVSTHQEQGKLTDRRGPTVPGVVRDNRV